MLPPSLSPGVARNRAAFLAQWSRLLESGLPAGQVATLLEQQPVGAPTDELASAVAEALRSGRPLGPALSGLAAAPSHYAAVLAAGEESGTVPAVLTQLAEDAELEAARKARLLSSLAYPALIFLVAGIVLPLPSLVQGRPGAAAWTALPLLGVPLTGLLLLAAGLRAAERGDGWPARLPGLARLAGLAARARWCRVSARLLSAGLALPATLRAAARAAGGGPVGEAALRVQREVEKGRELGASVLTQGLLTPSSAPLAAEADALGRGDDVFLRAARLIEDELDARVLARTRVVGAVAYAGAALFVASKVISFWSAALGAAG